MPGVLAGAVSWDELSIGNDIPEQINRIYRYGSWHINRLEMIHSFLDVGFLTGDRRILESMDEDRFYRPEHRFIVVETGLLI